MNQRANLNPSRHPTHRSQLERSTQMTTIRNRSRFAVLATFLIVLLFGGAAAQAQPAGVASQELSCAGFLTQGVPDLFGYQLCLQGQPASEGASEELVSVSPPVVTSQELTCAVFLMQGVPDLFGYQLCLHNQPGQGPAIANGYQGLYGGFDQVIADAYYDGDIQAAAEALYTSRPSGNTIEALVQTVADAYHGGDQRAALEAITGSAPPSITGLAQTRADLNEALMDALVSAYHGGDQEATTPAGSVGFTSIGDPTELQFDTLANSYHEGDREAASLAVTGWESSIEELASFVLHVANSYYDGDVVAACESVYEIFESDAQMNQVINRLTGS